MGDCRWDTVVFFLWGTPPMRSLWSYSGKKSGLRKVAASQLEDRLHLCSPDVWLNSLSRMAWNRTDSWSGSWSHKWNGSCFTPVRDWMLPSSDSLSCCFHSVWKEFRNLFGKLSLCCQGTWKSQSGLVSSPTCGYWQVLCFTCCRYTSRGICTWKGDWRQKPSGTCLPQCVTLICQRTSRRCSEVF